MLNLSANALQLGDCGLFVHKIHWFLDTQHSTADPILGGFIVQYMTASFSVAFCDGTPLHMGVPSPFPDPAQWPFYEAWTIAPGGRSPDRLPNLAFDDYWQMPDFGRCTAGIISFTGVAEYYDGQSLPPYFQPAPGGPGGLLSTSRYFTPYGPPTSSVTRTLTASWNCCCDPQKTIVIITP